MQEASRNVVTEGGLSGIVFLLVSLLRIMFVKKVESCFQQELNVQREKDDLVSTILTPKDREVRI